MDQDFLLLSLEQQQNSGVNSCREILCLLLFLPIDQDNPALANAEFKYVWKDVDFFESGRYKFIFQSDNLGTVFISMAIKLQRNLILEENLFQLTLKFLEESMMLKLFVEMENNLEMY